MYLRLRLRLFRPARTLLLPFHLRQALLQRGHQVHYRRRLVHLLDGDDLFWLIAALAATCAGVCAVTYVVWIAPSFLGEAALNAAVAGKVYHGMQRRGSSHWTEDQFRRTIVPALIVAASAAAAGYAFGRIAPEAVTIGGVWQHLAAKYGG